MIRAARTAFSDIWSPPFRSVFWKALGLTVALLLVIWIALQAALGTFMVLPWHWVETLIEIVAGFGSLILMAFLIAPITSAIAGIFLDDVAEVVEDTHYPLDPKGQALPFVQSIAQTIRFTLIVIGVNIVVLLLLLLPGINLIAFFVANGYLLGREYFELAAQRHMSREEVADLRRAKGGQMFLGGIVIAGFLAIPLLNLLTPLFATAFMVHLVKGIRAGEV
ncbi:MAG: sulfate transporter family protein [Rhodobiaceae bacterium]|nr:sulfate transporter family protein [Rhodobiaceae bacterium]